MLAYLTIQSDNCKWSLEAIYDEVKKQYCGVSLTNPIEYDWDSSHFLFKELAPLVLSLHVLDFNIAALLTENNEDVYHWLKANQEEIPQLNEILQYAIGLGWGKIK